jgi:hypothetical protein
LRGRLAEIPTNFFKKLKTEMKKNIYLVALVLMTSNLFAQITLEHSYPNGKWETARVKDSSGKPTGPLHSGTRTCSA